MIAGAAGDQVGLHAAAVRKDDLLAGEPVDTGLGDQATVLDVVQHFGAQGGVFFEGLVVGRGQVIVRPGTLHHFDHELNEGALKPHRPGSEGAIGDGFTHEGFGEEPHPGA